MYNPEPFNESRPEILHSLIREYPLALLVSSSGSEGLTATHVPMLFDPAGGGPNGALRCHVARANPHWRLLAESPEVLVVFSGPEHYITPSWYESKREHGKVVPTWNYTAVHVHGRARIFEEPAELISFLRVLTAAQEASFETPWSVDDAPASYVEGMAKAIVGIEIVVERMEGKWKLSQNRPAADRAGVIAGLEEFGSGRSVGTAAAMRDLKAK